MAGIHAQESETETAVETATEPMSFAQTEDES
jgi:hypothetical protein